MEDTWDHWLPRNYSENMEVFEIYKVWVLCCSIILNCLYRKRIVTIENGFSETQMHLLIQIDQLHKFGMLWRKQ